MKKQALTVGLLVICGAALATAQSSKSTEAEKDARNTMKVDTVIATGCVAQSSDGKGYVLDEATMAPRPIDNKVDGRPVAAPSGDKMVMTYILEGGNMKRHLGQKVEISASVIAENTMAMDHREVGGTLKVKTVKMIAASCT